MFVTYVLWHWSKHSCTISVDLSVVETPKNITKTWHDWGPLRLQTSPESMQDLMATFAKNYSDMMRYDNFHFTCASGKSSNGPPSENRTSPPALPNKSRNASRGVHYCATPISQKCCGLGENLLLRSSGASLAIRKWTRMQVLQSLSSLCCPWQTYDVNYMDCNQLVTSYSDLYKKFNHGGCTHTSNLPVSLHSALYLRNYTASNLGELFLYIRRVQNATS